MKLIHSDLADGRWFEFTFNEQMGNIGSEVGRVIRAQKNNKEDEFNNAVARALELFDLTAADPKRKNQLKEILRTREIFCDAISEKPEYNSNLEDIDKYLLQFAIAARLKY